MGIVTTMLPQGWTRGGSGVFAIGLVFGLALGLIGLLFAA